MKRVDVVRSTLVAGNMVKSFLGVLSEVVAHETEEALAKDEIILHLVEKALKRLELATISADLLVVHVGNVKLEPKLGNLTAPWSGEVNFLEEILITAEGGHG